VLGRREPDAGLELEPAARHHDDLPGRVTGTRQNTLDEQTPVADLGIPVPDDAGHPAVVIRQQSDLAIGIEAVEVDGDIAPTRHAHKAAGVCDH